MDYRHTHTHTHFTQQATSFKIQSLKHKMSSINHSHQNHLKSIMKMQDFSPHPRPMNPDILRGAQESKGQQGPNFNIKLLLLFGCSVMSDSLQPHGLQPTRPLCPCDFSSGVAIWYWSGLPFPSPGDFPNPGIEPMSPASPALAGRFFTAEPRGKPH